MEISSRGSALPAEWTEVLEQIQRALEKAIAATVEREQALSSEPPAADRESVPVRQPVIFDGVESFLQRADKALTQMDAGLVAGTESVQHWLEAAAQLRRRLAERAGRSV